MMMKRRTFLLTLASLGLLPIRGQTATPSPHRLLILIALKGGNDGLNTLIPYTDSQYRILRPDLAIPVDQVVKLSEQEGLHPQLAPLREVWQAGELALVRGVGYPEPNLSHFRSMDIWETGSASAETLTTGWLARCFNRHSPPADRIVTGVTVGNDAAGPLQGSASALTLTDIALFQQQARWLGLAPSTVPANPALRHIVAVENRIRQAAGQLKRGHRFETTFPEGPFGRALRTACEVIASRKRASVAVVHLSLPDFDTHVRQAARQARLLQQLAEGLVSLRAALRELGVWNETLVMTYSEFGRRPRQNANRGTDHGTASVQFVLGGAVKGGFHGAALDLTNLDSNGNPGFVVDFRSLYATVLEKWWGMESRSVLGERFKTLNLI
jgi:uncharacterized protein (DUF1501 family)